MDKQKALALLREILEVTQHDITSISVNQEKPGDFSLKINGVINEQTRNCITPLLAKDKLAMKQEDVFLVIYSAKL